MLVLVSTLVLLGSCALEPTSQGSPSDLGGSGLPELPTMFEEYPDLFTEDGCVVSEPEPPPGVLCVNDSQAEPSGEEASNPEGWKNLLGFQGPFYTDSPTGEGLGVLNATIRLELDSNFIATGLIRNESHEAVGSVMVEATLLDAEGVELAKTSTSVAIDPIRPGEPAPFSVQAQVLATDVADVIWTVSSGIPSPASREARIDVAWEAPFGDREPTQYDDEAKEPMPYLLVGQVVNLGATSISGPQIIYALVDEVGVVQTIGTEDLFLGEVGAVLDELRAEKDGIRGVGDFRVVVPNEDLAKAIEGSKMMLMLWMVGK
jgi:hypothetical protein